MGDDTFPYPRGGADIAPDVHGGQCLYPDGHHDGMGGTVEMAGNQIASVISNFAFMIILGIGSAVTICVSHAYGQRDWCEIRRYAGTAYRLGLMWNAVTALLFISLRRYIPMLFTSDPEVIEMAARFSGVRRRVPDIGRPAGEFGRHSARYSGRKEHHVDIIHLLHRHQPADRVLPRVRYGGRCFGIVDGAHHRPGSRCGTLQCPLPEADEAQCVRCACGIKISMEKRGSRQRYLSAV